MSKALSKAPPPRTQSKPARPERSPRPPRPKKDGLLPVLLALLVLLGLLVLPTLAVLSLPGTVNRHLVGGIAAGVSLVTLCLYWHDKQRAQNGGWRIPEATLHFCEAIGGWPGAFFAQRIFRHKNAKTSYQVVFWLIVTVYQFTAFDSFQHWRYSRQLFSLLTSKDVKPSAAAGKR